MSLARFVLALIVLLAGGIARAGISVWLPRQGAPAFVEPGGMVQVEVSASAMLATAGWTAAVRNDLREWACGVAARATSIQGDLVPEWRLELRLPRDIPPELMDVVVRHRDEGAATAVRAISIVPDLESDFYLLHLTDEHVREAKAAEGKEPAAGFRSAELVEWATPVVNLINPRFVVNSGDCTYQYHSSGERAHDANLIERYADAKAGYRVASVIVSGNHDVVRTGLPAHAESAARWEALLGPRTFALRAGSLFILGHDFHDEPLRAVAAAAYAGTADDPTVRGRLVIQHFAAYLEPDARDAFAFRPGPEVPAPTLMLIGHVHNTRVEQRAPFPVLMTVAAHRHARAGFVEMKKDEAGQWVCPSVATWGPQSAFGLVGDHGTPMVEAEFESANDGTAAANRVRIRNDLPQRFPDGRVRFLLASGTYAVTGGGMLAEYSYVDPAGVPRTAVLVKVDLPARGSVPISVTPSVARSRY